MDFVLGLFFSSSSQILRPGNLLMISAHVLFKTHNEYMRLASSYTYTVGETLTQVHYIVSSHRCTVRHRTLAWTGWLQGPCLYPLSCLSTVTTLPSPTCAFGEYWPIALMSLFTYCTPNTSPGFFSLKFLLCTQLKTVWSLSCSKLRDNFSTSSKVTTG